MGLLLLPQAGTRACNSQRRGTLQDEERGIH
jgi:hypothetical protein